LAEVEKTLRRIKFLAEFQKEISEKILEETKKHLKTD